MKKIAVITDSDSDLSNLLMRAQNIVAEKFTVRDINNKDLDSFDALCILGGTEKQPLTLPARARKKVEEQIENGKNVFVEYCLSICDTYSEHKAVPAYTRLVYLSDDYENLSKYDILDDQSDDFLPSYFKFSSSYPVLVYKDYIMAHYNTELLDNEKNDLSKWALWFLKTNVLVCNFRLSNFSKARFSPVYKWQSLVQKIFLWLTGILPVPLEMPFSYRLNITELPLEKKTELSFNSAINWFNNSGMLLNNGSDGILEGLRHEIEADGTQRISNVVRADCCGETSLAFYIHYLINGDKKSLEVFYDLQDYIYDNLQINGGIFDGMIRWSEVAWTVCYQDDVARAIIPSLLYTLYSGDDRYLSRALRALDFLLRTTCENGLRPCRTDNLSIADSGDLEQFKKQSNVIPSAHYNAYYHALLLIGYKLTGKKEYLECAVNGLESIMSVYPDTAREQSETEELCRLILPLSWLYWATQEQKHKDMLYRVCNDLQRLKRYNGAYIEWDTGFKANYSKKMNSESSLLVSNGDPICDFLYSMNWLPSAFTQAYLVTGDSYFHDLWRENADFFVSSQIKSENTFIDGCWARGFDPNIKEYYGIPHDIGWGPWAVETGWTVAEITSGLGMGLLTDSLKKFYL